MKVGEGIFPEAANAFRTDILLKQSIGYSCILCKNTTLHYTTPQHATLHYYYLFCTGTVDSFNLCFYLQFNCIISDIEIRSFNRLSQIPVAMWNYLLHGSVPGMTSPDREFWLNDCLQAKVDN